MKNKIQRMCVTATLIALATVLSLIKPFPLPFGGSVTPLSMLPAVLVPLMYGTRWGLIGTFANSVVQLLLSIGKVLTWGLTPAALVGTILLDYIIAYSVLGLSGVFRKKGIIGITCGVAMTLSLRFVCHFISGVIIFASITDAGAWVYSLTYNLSYMLPELITTTIATFIIFKFGHMKRIINNN